MKKLIFIGLLFLGFNSFAQIEYKVYNNTNGIPSIVPSQIIVQQPSGDYNVYQTNNGIINPVPSQIITPTNNGNYNIYNTNNGIPSTFPNQTIRK